MDWRVEAAQHAAERAAAVVHRRMARGLAGLATVAATAPVLGAAGTVWPVIEWSRLPPPGPYDCLSGGVSEAYIVLAFGLAVGIVASWCYRYLTARMDGFDVEMRHAARALPRLLAISI